MKEVLIHYWECEYCGKHFDTKWECDFHEINVHKCPICKYSYRAATEFGGCKVYDQTHSTVCKFEKKDNV